MSNAMRNLSYGLFVVTSKNNIKQNGCITNTAIQVTTTPNQVTLAVNNANYTCDLIKQSGIFNVSILTEKASFDTFKHFGFQSGRDVDKFSDFADYKVASNGVNYITKGVNSVICCKVVNSIDLGTHTLFIAEVTEEFDLNSDKSATYAYYFENIKPKPQAKKVQKTVWRCNICGYEEEVEELPDDFICPLCNHPKSDFTKITQ